MENKLEQKKSYSEVLLYLALNIKDFEISPHIKLETDLPQKVRDDIKNYFCSYESACKLANQLFLEIYHFLSLQKNRYV